MSFSETLKRIMDSRGKRAADLARETGLSEAIISGYLRGTHEPRGRQSILLSQALGVSLDTLWETQFAGNDADIITSAEREMIKKYRALDVHGKGTVDMILEREYSRSFGE